MRFQFSPLTGNSYDTALLFLRRSVTTRLLAVGLPGAAILLLCLIAFVSRNTGTAITAALERNAQLRAGSVSLILEQIFTETRNQLLILAAGPISRQTMDDRLRFRAKAGGIHYREVAFMARNSSDSFLIINHDGEIVSVPLDVARQAIGSPFNMGEIRHTANHVHMGQPLEVSYPPLPFKGAMQSPRLQVLRFSTPIFDDNNQYQGLLILSLDLSVLRDAISMFSSSESSFWQNSNLSHVRSVFFDAQGWMIFQSEKKQQGTAPLSLNDIRKGFGGDFGRPGFNSAFRPYPRHLRWWEMVAAVQEGKSGRISISSRDEGWSDTAFSDVHASYAPIFFSSAPDAVPDVIGGIAVLDGMPSDVGGLYIFQTLLIGAGLCLLFMGILLWRTGRVTDRILARFADEVDATTKTSAATPIPELPNAPHTLNRARDSVNRLLLRLRRAEDEHNSWHDQQQTLWEREPCDLIPENVAAPSGLVGESSAMNELREHIARAAPSDADILVIGETGTGKELVSRAIHEASPRRDGPFITINCGALDENLLMDTLFGHVKGAFTEARQPRKGAFLAAEGGTLMLDEVGNASPKVQQALLRALSTRAMRPLGSDEEVPFNTRIIAATNALLPRDENFREDLFYRLAVITIQTPPLRDRREDLPALASYFLAHEAAARNVPVPAVSRGALNMLMECGWPGNVRQLRNCLIRALAFCENGIIQAENIQLEILPLQSDDLPPAPAGNGGAPTPPSENPASPPQGGEKVEENIDGDLPPRIAAVLPRMAAAGRVSRQEYQALAGENISMRTAQYDLQLLQKLGLVEKQGRGPAQRYVLTSDGEERARRCQHRED